MRFEDLLENSRLAQSIEQVERGETVDWEKVAELQALDLARLGELYTLDCIQRERQADDQLEEQLRGSR